jgi:hypothetical protein
MTPRSYTDVAVVRTTFAGIALLGQVKSSSPQLHRVLGLYTEIVGGSSFESLLGTRLNVLGWSN